MRTRAQPPRAVLRAVEACHCGGTITIEIPESIAAHAQVNERLAAFEKAHAACRAWRPVLSIPDEPS